jgi:hypothetical protein
MGHSTQPCHLTAITLCAHAIAKSYLLALPAEPSLRTGLVITYQAGNRRVKCPWYRNTGSAGVTPGPAADLHSRLSQLGDVHVVELSQYEAWLDADELERLADVVDRVTSYTNADRILALRSYVHVDDVENTSDYGVVEMVLIPDPDPWGSSGPYYALLYDGPASDPRASFILGSENLRTLAARLRAIDPGEEADSPIITLDEVDDGTHDSDVHPQFRVEKKPDVTDQAVVHLWFDYLERFPPDLT